MGHAASLIEARQVVRRAVRPGGLVDSAAAAA
jgi:hypothetical protein